MIWIIIKLTEISFQHAKRTTINFPLDDGVIYAFGNKINLDFRHYSIGKRKKSYQTNKYMGIFKLFELNIRNTYLLFYNVIYICQMKYIV